MPAYGSGWMPLHLLLSFCFDAIEFGKSGVVFLGFLVM